MRLFDRRKEEPEQPIISRLQLVNTKGEVIREWEIDDIGEHGDYYLQAHTAEGKEIIIHGIGRQFGVIIEEK